MSHLKVKILIIILASILATGILSSTTAAIAFSGNSVNSLSISSVRSETSTHYLIEINIKGIPTSDVAFGTDFQTLYLSAKSGGMVTEGAIAGAQVIGLSFEFPANANLKNYHRENKPNKILIRIPKT